MRLPIVHVLFLLLMTFGVKAQQADVTANNKDSRFLFSANVNYSYRLGEIDDSFSGPQREYLKNLLSGVSYDFSAYYMWNHFGFGLKYNAFRSKGEAANVNIIAPNGNTGFGTISDDITIAFYGTGIFYEIGRNSSRHKAYVETSIGYLEYINNAYALGNYKYKGGTLGGFTAISYQYEAFDNFSFGPKLSIMVGALDEYTIHGPNGYKESVNPDDDHDESLSTINIGLVASYRF